MATNAKTSAPASSPKEREALVDAPCVDRINVEPSILLGLSSSEAFWTIVIAFAIWVPIGALVGLVARSMAIGVLVATVTPMASVYIAAKKMASVKRDRPDLFYLHLFRQSLARTGVRRSRFVIHFGGWDLGRSLPPLLPGRSKKRNGA
jgi:conjugative transfer region protein (TIGR03750 family)